MIDPAAQALVGDQAGQLRGHPQAIGPTEMLERRRGDRREPELRPGQGRGGEEGERLLAEDLVTDRLVEEVTGRQARRAAVALIENALGLEEQRLAEALRADHDELVIAIEIQEVVDLRRVVQESVVEIFGDANVVVVHGPRAHTHSVPQRIIQIGAIMKPDLLLIPMGARYPEMRAT